MTAQSVAPRRIKMTFPIDSDNNITAFASKEEATAATAGPFDFFADQAELEKLVSGWPGARLVDIWNSLPGVVPVKRFQSGKVATKRIWERIQPLTEATKPLPPKPKLGAKAPKAAP